jgi:hypothetical protein
MPASAADFMFQNDRWQVALDPSTLAATVTVVGEKPLRVSKGGKAHEVAVTASDTTRAEWAWEDAAYEFSARLDSDDLVLTVRAGAPGELTLVRQTGEAMGGALILPLGEGHYIPRGDDTWTRFLTTEAASLDSVEDLSLPLWSNAVGSRSLTWMLPDSYDNRLRFGTRGNALTIELSHRFTSLAFAEPVVLMLHLSAEGHDPLAGAKRYRRWLIDNGRFEPLARQVSHTPGASRLIGATHIYLWGHALIAPEDVLDWQAFGSALRGDSELATALRGQLDEEATTVLPRLHRATVPERRAVIHSLNEAFANLARRRWMGGSPDMRELGAYLDLRARAARLFAGTVDPDAARWGGWTRLAEALGQAGLRRLWLGHGQGWEAGLWHPEAVRTGVDAGFLVAPYDSYETALPESGDPSWTTAHLGREAFDRCGIQQRNGSPQAGFGGKGRYTDPRCMSPMLDARIAAIRTHVPYNAWFLDAYGTGMSFESYRKAATMTRRQNVEGATANMGHVRDAHHMPVGSEGGNALAASGLAYAHGMQTPVIGWSDPDLGQGKVRNTSSPYFVGPWYPANEPAVFFKAVPTKPVHRRIHFDPRYRLPLYQAVFHDAVIATHHWLYDSMKLADIRVERELTQLLYNVPALYHLSTGTLGQRLPLILRQDRFFGPLHRRLANQALTAFEWLTPDRRLQRTTFTDGTRLVANFSGEARTADKTTFPAQSVTAVEPDGSVLTFSAD